MRGAFSESDWTTRRKKGGMTGTQLPIELAELTSMLAALSSELVQARLAVKPVPVDTAEEDDAMEAEEEEPSRFDGTRYAQRVAPLFAALHASNRRALSLSAECRGSTSKARREMDERYLALQVRICLSKSLSRKYSSLDNDRTCCLRSSISKTRSASVKSTNRATRVFPCSLSTS